MGSICVEVVTEASGEGGTAEGEHIKRERERPGAKP